MKRFVELNGRLLCAWVGLNVIFLSAGFGSTKSKGRNATTEYEINYSSQMGPMWSRSKNIFCPKYCRCHINKVSCRNKRLTEAPLFRTNAVETLTIQKTRIKFLRKEHFRQMFHLTELQLDGNELVHIHERVFEDLIKLKILNLSGNKLTEINDHMFRHLVSLKELDLNNNYLLNIERGLGFLANLNALFLSGNRIKSISNLTFYGNWNVRILDLSFNHLKAISPVAFSRMKNLAVLLLRNNPLHLLDVRLESNIFLEQLDVTRCRLERMFIDSPRRLKDLRLSGNKLTSIEDKDFVDSNAIRLLLLDDNEIETLSDTAFDYMPLLHDLYISKNRLTKLPASVPGSLYSLYASHNDISSITWKPLARKYNLRHLVLGHNRISHIDPNAMRSLTYLVHLDLSHNKIKYLKAGTFGRTVSLEKLDLSHNPLHLLEPGCFIGLRKLHILKMSSVLHRMELGVTAFDDLANLLYLDLSNSSQLTKQLLGGRPHGGNLVSLRSLNVINAGLKELSHKVKRNLQNLTTVRMANNPWNCSRKLLWIRDWIRTSTIDFYEPENLVCKSPLRLRGKRLVDLTSYDVVTKKRRSNGETKDENLFRKKLKTLKRSLRKAFNI